MTGHANTSIVIAFATERAKDLWLAWWLDGGGDDDYADFVLDRDGIVDADMVCEVVRPLRVTA